jgi:hypothetical protein
VPACPGSVITLRGFTRASTTTPKKGASLDDVLKANPVADLEPRWSQGFPNCERFLRMAYPSIAKHDELMKTTGTHHVSW